MISSEKVVVFGSFGFGNIGDEAIPYALLDIGKSINKNYDITIVSRFGSPSMKSVQGLDSQYINTLQTLNDAPVIIAGGGIIEPKEISCVLRYKQYLNYVTPKKSAIIAGSFEFGVDYSWRMKRKLRRIFHSLEKIYTRDYLSELYLRDTFPELEVSTLGDMVLGMRPDTSPPKKLYLEKNNYIAICLTQTWSDDPKWLPWITQELLTLSNSLNKSLLFVPMSCHPSDDDRQEHTKIIKQLELKGIINKPIHIDKQHTPKEISAIFRDANIVVAMRLHSCVMAYAQKTPFVGISYHPKLLGFAQTIGWRPFLLPEKNMPSQQDTGKYGYDFSSLSLSKNDLYRKAEQALEHGSFNLLPVFTHNLQNAVSDFLGK